MPKPTPAPVRSEVRGTEYGRWLDRLQDAQEVQALHQKDWNRWIQLYLYGTTREYSKRLTGLRVDQVRVNRAHAFVRSVLPRILFREPRFYAEPRRPGAEESAWKAILLTDYLFSELGIFKQVRLCATDALVMGIGIMKLGFDSEYGVGDPQELTQRIEASAQVEAAREMVRQVRIFAGLGPPRPKSTDVAWDEDSTDYNENVAREWPWALRHPPSRFLVDPEALSIEDARWVAFGFDRPLEDAREDERYNADQRKRLRGSSFQRRAETVFDEPDDPTLNRRGKGSRSGRGVIRSRVTGEDAPSSRQGAYDHRMSGWEVWSKKERKVLVISEELDSYLMKEEWPFRMLDGFPCVVAGFSEVPDRFYPKSYFQDMEPKIHEINRIRQHSLNWFKKHAKGLILAKGLSDKEKEQITGPEPFALIDVEGVDPREALHVADFGQFPPALYQIEEHLTRDLWLELGLGPEQEGSPVSGITATTSANVEAATSIRIQDMARRIEVFVRDVARKLYQITKQFFPESVAMYVTGRAPGDEWVEVTAEEVRREYDIRIEAGSMQQGSDEVMKRQLVELMQTLAPIHQAGLVPGLNWTELVREAIYAFGKLNPDRILSVSGASGAPDLMTLLQALQQGGAGISVAPGGQEIGFGTATGGTNGAPLAGQANPVSIASPQPGTAAQSMRSKLAQQIGNRVAQQRVAR